MTNGECIYRKTVDYMSRMALEKDDFRRFSVIWEFRVTGNWVAARVASRKWAFNSQDNIYRSKEFSKYLKASLKVIKLIHYFLAIGKA